MDWIPAVDILKVDYGFDFDIDSVKALTACCRRHNSRKAIKHMKMLLEHCVDLDAIDEYGPYALRYEKPPAFEMLTKNGAWLEAKTSEGETILRVAVKWTHAVATVLLLANAGIMQLDLDAPDYNRKTAFNVLRLRAADTDIWCLTVFPCFSFERGTLEIEDHTRIIEAFERLFQEIQEHQGVPLTDRYPALHITALGEQRAAEPVEDIDPVSSGHTVHEATDGHESSTVQDSTESHCAPPGAWPE